MVDESARMLVVDADPAALRDLVEDLSEWVVAPLQTYGVPDTRKRVDGPPD